MDGHHQQWGFEAARCFQFNVRALVTSNSNPFCVECGRRIVYCNWCSVNFLIYKTKAKDKDLITFFLVHYEFISHNHCLAEDCLHFDYFISILRAVGISYIFLFNNFSFNYSGLFALTVHQLATVHNLIAERRGNIQLAWSGKLLWYSRNFNWNNWAVMAWN